MSVHGDRAEEPIDIYPYRGMSVRESVIDRHVMEKDQNVLFKEGFYNRQVKARVHEYRPEIGL